MNSNICNLVCSFQLDLSHALYVSIDDDGVVYCLNKTIIDIRSDLSNFCDAMRDEFGVCLL